MEIELLLNEPHPGQLLILEKRKRFNTICCGRRWGKTTMCQELLLCPDDPTNGALNGYPVAYYAPTNAMLMEVWREMLSIIGPVIEKKSETQKRIQLYGGGVIDFWSLDDIDTSRGRKYKRALVDEAAKVKRLKEAWKKTIRPTLTDYKGDAFFLSTPRGKNNDFYEFSKYDGWGFWQMPTVSNPHIDPAEVEEARLQLDPLSFAQEYLASFVTENLDSFAYAFNPEKHLKSTKWISREITYLSFDFNRNPITCLVVQHSGTKISVIEQIKLQNSNIYDLCDHILSKYRGAEFMVTGDATGKASSALVQDNINYYTVIKSKLNLSNGQLKLPSVNPPVRENRVLVNSVLHNLDVAIDPVNAKGLIFDLEHASVLPDGSLDKSDRNDPTKQLDCLDTFRYYLNAFFRHILKQ